MMYNSRSNTMPLVTSYTPRSVLLCSSNIGWMLSFSILMFLSWDDNSLVLRNYEVASSCLSDISNWLWLGSCLDHDDIKSDTLEVRAECGFLLFVVLPILILGVLQILGHFSLMIISFEYLVILYRSLSLFCWRFPLFFWLSLSKFFLIEVRLATKICLFLLLNLCLSFLRTMLDLFLLSSFRLILQTWCQISLSCYPL